MAEPPIQVGRILVDDREGRYVIHAVVTPSGPYCGRHVISISVDISAVSYDHHFDLTRRESDMIGTTGAETYFRKLAQQVQDNPRRYAFRPIEAAPGFTL